MSELSPGANMATVAIVAMPLVFCCLLPSLAHADGASSPELGVIDAFINARATRDANAVAALFDEDAEVLDSSHNRVTGTQGLSQLLAIGETIVADPPQQTQDDEVMWTETVWWSRQSWEADSERMNDNDTLDLELSMQGVGQQLLTAAGELPATSATRVMRARVSRSRIIRLTVTRGAAPEASGPASSAKPQTPPIIALAATVALLGSVLLVGVVGLDPKARPASNRGRLVRGLNGWLAVRHCRRQGS